MFGAIVVAMVGAVAVLVTLLVVRIVRGQDTSLLRLQIAGLACMAVMMVLAGVAGAQYATKVYMPQGGDSLEVASGGAINVASGGAITNAGTLIQSGNLTVAQQARTNSAVSLTSPTTTFSAVGKGLVTLIGDANLTGIYPTGGTLWQEITIRSGAGSNTLRFDDGTSMSLGANITLTESQNDCLILRCISADGDEWECVSAHDN